MIISGLQWFLLIVGLIIACGSLLSLSQHPHWFVRGWDFARLQSAVIIAVCAAGYSLLQQSWSWTDWLAIAFLLACLVWHLSIIVRYTPLWRQQVQPSERSSGDRTLRFAISNVQMPNRDYDRWKSVILNEQPDTILEVETDHGWCDVLHSLKDDYPHQVFQPQDNKYGMALISKLQLIDPEINFIVDQQYPSIHTGLRLPGGDVIQLWGVHPPPPEPIRDKSARERNAELVIIGRDRIDRDQPTIIAGDLNDVAWSHSTRLFQRVSGMLDPRIGRGFFNSWDVNSHWRRAPLDHVFHTDHFRLRSLRRLDAVGSDHFPMLIQVNYEPSAKLEQQQSSVKSDDHDEAQKKIRQQKEHGGINSR
ncbi:MAG: endonuclease/exonuclease/phosphatase family protein [Fuerstiella sp.]